MSITGASQGKLLYPGGGGIPVVANADSSSSNVLAVPSELWIQNGSGLYVPVSSSVPLPVSATFTGSIGSVQKASAEAAAESYQKILDIVGINNVISLLPCDETSGSLLYDLLDRNLTFDVSGATLGATSPLGSAVSFDGVSNYAIHTALVRVTGTMQSWARLTSSGAAVAQKLGPFADRVSFVEVFLQTAGSPSASLQAQLVADSSGSPGGTVLATSTNTIAVGSMTAGETYLASFNFAATFVACGASSPVWLVLSYSSATTVDSGDYVAMEYDDTGAYGYAMATYDGSSWTVDSGSSAFAALYGARLLMASDTSILVLAKAAYSSTNPATLQYYATPGINRAPDRLVYTYANGSPAEVQWFGKSETPMVPQYSYSRSTPGQWHLYGVTASVSASTAKAQYYLDGRLDGTANGTADYSYAVPGGPMILGASYAWPYDTAPANFAASQVGMILIASGVLTAAQMAAIAEWCFPNRARGTAV